MGSAQIHATREATGFIPAHGDAITASTVDSGNADATRATKETDKQGEREKLPARIWPACWLSACSENSLQVAQATRLCRPATRRTERKRRFELMRTAFSQRGSGQFRSAGRRPWRASRPRYPFPKHALSAVEEGTAWQDCRRAFRIQFSACV
jgi:hypothetical protein